MKRKLLTIAGVSLLLLVLCFSASADGNVINFENPSDLTGVTWQDDTVFITVGGTYTITGTTEAYAVEVDASGAVELILNNVSMTTADRPAIKIENANTITLTLAEGSVNTLVSSGDCKGTVHAKAELTIDGSGELNIGNSTTKGIYGKKHITIAGGILNINSQEDGIHGKKDVTVSSGEITIDTNGDGISAADDLRVTGGSLNITTHGQPVPVQTETAEADQAEAETVVSDNDAPEETVFAAAEGEQLIDLDNGVFTGVTVSEDTILIADGGDYRLKGTSDKYSVRVETAGDVNLILDGVHMSVAETPLLYVETAGSITLTLAEGFENDVSAIGESRAVLFAKTNLTIDGAGSLNVTADASKGIKSMYTLIINNGVITVDTKNDAISVEEDLEINGGVLSLTTRSVALAVGGEIRNNGGDVTVDQPETAETESAEPEEAETATEGEPSSEGKFEYVKNWTVIEDGEVVDIGNTETATVEMDFETACKGLKAEDKIEISGGIIVLNTADHAIRSVGDMTITGGDFTISSTYGKAISAHGNLVIDGSDTRILINQCTEGIEGKQSLTINDGVMVIHASDDALNAGNADVEVPGVVLTINGGDIEADSMDDCIDANGILQMNGGLVKASKSKGTVVGFNAVLSGTGIELNPGVSLMITIGNPGDIEVSIDQTALLVYFTETHTAGETVTLSDVSGNELASYMLPMSCSAVYITMPGMAEGTAYMVCAGDETVEATTEGLFTVIGTPLENAEGGNGYSHTDGEEGDGGFQWQSHYNGY